MFDNIIFTNHVYIQCDVRNVDSQDNEAATEFLAVGFRKWSVFRERNTREWFRIRFFYCGKSYFCDIKIKQIIFTNNSKTQLCYFVNQRQIHKLLIENVFILKNVIVEFLCTWAECALLWSRDVPRLSSCVRPSVLPSFQTYSPKPINEFHQS